MSINDTLAPIKAREDELTRLNTRELAAGLLAYGDTYKLLARVEADHRRLIAAVQAAEAACAATDTETSEALQADLVARIRAAFSEALG